MINLLPDNEKKAIEKEYKLRRFIIVLWGFLFLTIATLLFMMPSFVLALYKGKETNTEIAKAAAVDKAQEEKSKKEIETAKALMKVLQPETGVLLPSDIIDIVNKDRGTGNVINNITYSRSEDSSNITVILTGVAKTRQSLSQFKEALTAEKGITKVDIPVSNFAKDANIAFTCTLTIKIN